MAQVETPFLGEWLKERKVKKRAREWKGKGRRGKEEVKERKVEGQEQKGTIDGASGNIVFGRVAQRSSNTAIIVQRSDDRSGKGKGSIEKGEVNEGKERKARHARRGKGDIKERTAKEKGREGERKTVQREEH